MFMKMGFMFLFISTLRNSHTLLGNLARHP